MGIFGNYTFDQLKDILLPLDKTQILTLYNNKLSNRTKKELLILALKILDVDIENLETQDREEGEDCPNGQVWKLRVIRDILGNKLRSTKFDWSYYPEGEVDIITTTEMDASDKVIAIKRLKHYPDGRQPEEI